MKEMFKIFVALVGYIGKVIDCEVAPYNDYLEAARKTGSKHARAEAIGFAVVIYIIAAAVVAAIMIALYWAIVWLWATTPQSWW